MRAKTISIEKRNNTLFDMTDCVGDAPGHIIAPRFEHFTSVEMYENAGLKGYAPMTAKEIETEEQQDAVLNDSQYIIEEKFDGTRALLYFLTRKPLKSKDYNDDEFAVRHSLLRGSSFVHGNDRIYEFFLSHPSTNDRAEFLKKEFGIGGGTVVFPDESWGNRNFNAKGYEVTYHKKCVKYPWTAIANIFSELIDSGAFYPQEAYTRCFSRRVSEKTGWYCENTDSLPQLRRLDLPEMNGTILDGEMFIPNRPFKDVSSTLNCKWDKAIDRQLELGYIVFHAFDILFYKGIDLRKMPLKRRKHYLKLAVEKIDSPYVKLVDYHSCGSLIPVKIDNVAKLRQKESSYPNLVKEINALDKGNNPFINPVGITPRAYYEYVVATGGEGVMVKPIDGKYHHKRGREYQKIKKFLTREVVIMGFTDPTDEYKGKFPTIEKWDYWETNDGDRLDLSHYSSAQREQFKRSFYPDECRPISKHYCNYWVGTIRFGVVVTPEEVKKLPKSKKFNIEEMIIEGDDVLVLEVGECSGFDEETREMFSADPESWKGKVIEIKANEIFKDTGKLRHPRYLRLREDKSPLECTYKDHISD